MKNVKEMSISDIKSAVKLIASLSSEGYSKHDLESIAENNPEIFSKVYLGAFTSEKSKLMSTTVMESISALSCAINDRLGDVRVSILDDARNALSNIKVLVRLIEEIANSSVVDDSPLLSLQTYNSELSTSELLGNVDIIKTVATPYVMVSRDDGMGGEMLRLEIDNLFRYVSKDNSDYSGSVLSELFNTKSMTINNAVTIIRDNAESAVCKLNDELCELQTRIGDARIAASAHDELNDAEVAHWLEISMRNTTLRKYAEDEYSIAMLGLIKHIMIIDRVD